ncbi:hypothetical protein EYF80_000018 [Liparis tanakae]|uniref:Uncharacterized protein n=1 Tax=Liparis tanakae TaxID=230148 RepID=A0A4Z2JGN4_9TELE|nr:hypothetical protein EYF80_000018 [Liparis tanakae]
MSFNSMACSPVDTAEEDAARSAIRSPTLISMGRRKNRHFSFLEGSGTSRTKRPYLYLRDTSGTQ